LGALVLSLAVFLIVHNIARADPFDTWSWRYPIPQGHALHAVTYGNGQFVAVGDYGTIITSTNGYDWTIQSAGQFPQLLGVGSSGGNFAAVGVGGFIALSSNGVNWILQTSPVTNTLRAVAGNPNTAAVFTAVGDSGAVVKHPFGTNWLKVGYNVTNNFRAVTYESNSVYVAGDGIYIAQTNIFNPGYSLQCITFANGQPTLGGSLSSSYGTTAIFPNPILTNSTWVNTSPGFPGYYTVSGLAFGDGVYAATYYSAYSLEYNYPGYVISSTDGTNWTYGSGQSGDYLYSIAFGNSVFVAVGEAGSIVISPDGVNWTDITGFHRTAITSIACSQNLCIAAGQEANQYLEYIHYNFSTLVSSNGADWRISTTNLPCLVALAASGNTFVGVSAACAYTTADGYNWTQNCIASNNLRAVGYGAGKFFAVGDRGAIFYFPGRLELDQLLA